MDYGGIPINQIKFSRAWPKLVGLKTGDTFHTVRFGDKEEYYRTRVGEKFRVVIRGKWYYFATLESVDTKLLRDILEDPEFVKRDTTKDTTPEQFYSHMEGWYTKKTLWNGIRSPMVILNFRVSRVEAKMNGPVS